MDNQIHPIIHQDISTHSPSDTHRHTLPLSWNVYLADYGASCWERLRRTDRQARVCAHGAAPTTHTKAERRREGGGERGRWMKSRKKATLAVIFCIFCMFGKIRKLKKWHTDIIYWKRDTGGVALIEGMCWLCMTQSKTRWVWMKQRPHQQGRGTDNLDGRWISTAINFQLPWKS